MSAGYAEIAITSVLNSEKSFCKFLSANDTGATGAHQSGILISKTAMEMLFSREQLEQEGIPKRTVKIKWQNKEKYLYKIHNYSFILQISTRIVCDFTSFSTFYICFYNIPIQLSTHFYGLNTLINSCFILAIQYIFVTLQCIILLQIRDGIQENRY